MHLLDVERLKFINSPEYSGVELCPRCREKYQTRIIRERLYSHADVVENYLPILADETIWPPNAGNPNFFSDRWHWKFSVNVNTKKNNGIVDAYFNTLLSMKDDDFHGFIKAAKKSIKKGRIIYPDGIFITNPMIEDCQKRLDDFEKGYE